MEVLNENKIEIEYLNNNKKTKETPIREDAAKALSKEGVEPIKSEKSTTTSVEFGKSDSPTGGIKFKIIDNVSGEIIREFPKESLKKAVDVSKMQSLSGVLLDSDI